MRIISTAATGVRAQQLVLDTTADNLANIDTTGFKARQVDFAEALAVSERPTGNDDRLTKKLGSVDIGAGIVYRNTPLNTEQGQFIKTDKPLDLAIDGPGYFQVQTNNGQIAYTRAGSFRVDYVSNENGQQVGRLVDMQGNLLKVLEPFNIPESTTNLTITETGQIIGTDYNNQQKNHGQIVLAGFTNPSLLNSIGDNMYVATDGSGDAQELLPGNEKTGKLKSNTLENSNVNMAKEMTELLQAQRAYQMNVRIIQNGDKMWEIANSLRR